MFLKTLDSKGAIIINKEHQYMMEVLVEGTRVMQMAKLFRGRDIPFDVIVSDASGCGGTRRTRSPLATRLRCPITLFADRSLDWRDFYPLHVVYAFLNDLEKAFPSTCTVSVIGRSVEGRDIKMLKISNSDANNTGIWLDGATHAREWISTAVVTYIADYLARNFDTLSVNYTSKDWYFVPVVNPDGYQHSHTVDRMWRKNRATFGNVISGVDLNRNFGYFWGRGGIEHSSGDPNHLNYRGPEPFSEPETTAIKDIILYSGTPFKIFLSFHACSEAISFPWCHTADPCPDYVNLLEGGTAMAKAIFETTGRMYKVGNFKDIMYYASGTSIDWSYGTARIPFSYLVELRSKQDRFTLPREEIIICCKEILNGVKALVEFSDKKKCLNCSVIPKKLRN
ncbi:carboxypeptidase B-like isoform X1 [Spodoptera litura]|uniref:Carboxypeptidase B-like isoform X1 n=1 Tax=Spodoptera litura TaxID=69820 RepID=A0A9J7E2S4_SPOLT|nr:carboxypeptidase B-like isoform X1 [Spodoptera litura]